LCKNQVVTTRIAWAVLAGGRPFLPEWAAAASG